MLKRAKERLSPKAFKSYHHKASQIYNQHKNQYLIDPVHAIYENFEDENVTGGVDLDLNKVGTGQLLYY
jgi:hypothetical protein